MRYLMRLTNDRHYTPKDARTLQEKIRNLLGSPEKIGNLRVSSSAIEFDLLVDQAELENSKNILESKISRVITFRPIDNRASIRNESESLLEGIKLFNEERFWEAHEALEEIWHPSRGEDRNVIQGLILSSAAFVHYQKNEANVCISILGRALEKLGLIDDFRGIDVRRLKLEIMNILEVNIPQVLQIRWTGTKTTLQTP